MELWNISLALQGCYRESPPPGNPEVNVNQWSQSVNSSELRKKQKIVHAYGFKNILLAP